MLEQLIDFTRYIFAHRRDGRPMSGPLATGSLDLALGGGQVASLFLVLMRTTGLVVTAPILGHRRSRRRSRPGSRRSSRWRLARSAAVAPGALPLIVAAPIELLIGLCLGTVISIGFQAIELGGRLISLQMGLSLGAVFSPTAHEGGTPFDPFFSVLAGLLFLALDLHLAVVRALAVVVRDAADRRRLADRPVAARGPADGARASSSARGSRCRSRSCCSSPSSPSRCSRARSRTINVFILGLPLKITVGIAVTALALPEPGRRRHARSTASCSTASRPEWSDDRPADRGAHPAPARGSAAQGRGRRPEPRARDGHHARHRRRSRCRACCPARARRSARPCARPSSRSANRASSRRS